MKIKRERCKRAGALGAVPERHGLPSAGSDADGPSARVNGCGVVEIHRGPAPVLPAILERVGVNVLMRLGGQGKCQTPEEGMEAGRSQFANRLHGGVQQAWGASTIAIHMS